MADDEHSVDRYLVNRVVADQDTRAFGELVERHQSHVRNFLRKLSRDPVLADDLAQDCFIHAWEKLHTYSGKGTVIGWLLKVAYTTFLQSKRRSRRYDDVLDEVGQASQTSVDPAGGEEATDLDRFMAVLNEEERAVMIMAYALGMSHREIGEATSQPIGTVKSIIFRGKERIRERFAIESRQHG